jgi:hypothetical protein
MRFFILFFLTVLFVADSEAQSYAFGLKLGPTIGIQQWNGFSGRDPLFKYHGDLFIESASDEDKFSLYAELGYHIKGSSLRTNAYYNPHIGQNIEARTSSLQFKNAALEVGAKQKFDFGLASKAYYGFGLRAEYNIDVDLDGFFRIYEGLENKFVYGVTVSAGMEIPFSPFVSGIIEASVSPDLSKQIYILPQKTGFTNASGEIITPEQSVVNTVFEISFGIRFLHEITYID